MLHTTLHTLHKHATRAPPPLIFSFKKDVMGNKNQPTAKKVIRCTPENARDMQQAVKAWPALHALVQDLQTQGMFPGLRGLTITIIGTEELVGKGLGAVAQINAAKAV